MRRTVNPQITRFKKAFLQIQKLPFNDFFPSDVISDIIQKRGQRRTEKGSETNDTYLSYLFFKFNEIDLARR